MHTVDIASLDLNLLKVLDALLKEGSVTRAGTRLGLSQPATSRALARLRKLLGDPLLVRTSQGQELTPRALSLADPLERLLAELRHIVRPARFEPATLEGRFTIASMDHLTTLMIPGLMARLATQAPKVEVVVLPARGDNVDLVARGDADIAVGRFSDDALPANMHRKTVYDETLACIVRRDHPALQRPWHLDAFLALAHVATTITGDGPGIVDEVLSRMGHARHVALRLPQFLTAPMVVAASDMLAVIPRRLAEHLSRQLPITLRDLPIDVRPFTLSMIWHARTHRDESAAWLRDQLLGVVSNTSAPGIQSGMA